MMKQQFRTTGVTGSVSLSGLGANARPGPGVDVKVMKALEGLEPGDEGTNDPYREEGKFVEVRSTKGDPDYGMDNSGIAKRASYSIGLPVPDDDLPDMVYVSQGLWSMIKSQMQVLMADPPKASIGNLEKLAKIATDVDKAIEGKLDGIAKRKGKGPRFLNPGRTGTIELTERRVRVTLDELVMLEENTEDLNEFHKQLTMAAASGKADKD